MPELPEVETVRRTLEQLVLGKTIKDIGILYSRIIRTPADSEQFKILLKGQTLQSLARRGKYLLFYFDDVVMISHLRMEGKYVFVEDSDSPYDKHIHIIFHFTDGTSLRYRDVRKFGTMDVIPLGMEEAFPALQKQGQEPIDPNFDKELFKKEVQSRKAPIKQILLNQEIVSGLGNIYVDDSLAISKIHPTRLGNSLTNEEIDRLVVAMKDVLLKAIEYGGSSIRSFESLYGRGSMQDHLIVYGKQGRPCVFCGTPIEKIRVAGRGTHYCPDCQK